MSVAREQQLSAVPAAAPINISSPTAHGKFLFEGGEKFWVKGVTYGTFAANADGSQFPDQAVVVADFAAMALHGINTLRTYTVPPRWLLDAAHSVGLKVMVGLAWTQHVAFLDDNKLKGEILRSIRMQLASCLGHPAILCYAIGNEIPAPIVRWHGRRSVERFLERIYQIVKSMDSRALVTYVNYPTTEYLALPFLDVVCFNVYLESPDTFSSYIARLHNVAGDRPLLLTEIGVDSLRKGELQQSRMLDWQLRQAFAGGAAGACVFSWTDDWYRGGDRVDDWKFGITTANRKPKPALHIVQRVYTEAPFNKQSHWPLISIVVCSYNGAATIEETLSAIGQLDYPAFETIVVDDGSTDATATIAKKYAVQLISTENRGLSAARNTGWQAANGEIVAYIDDDAYPDPHWLSFLAHSFTSTDYAAVGGPNIPPTTDGEIAECVAKAPGGPLHVLITDTLAEHIPGCNMAFRREALAEIEGFDAMFRTAGDDVDVCWRLQQAGHEIGFSPSAVVWHHRRNSLAAYWKQQWGYGHAEALLEAKWPEKYNALGHTTWEGRIYGTGPTRSINQWQSRVYQGTWGTEPFQRLYVPSHNSHWAIPIMPEWYLLILLLGVVSLIGTASTTGWVATGLLAVAIAVVVSQAILSVPRQAFASTARGHPLVLRCTTIALHILQPVARLSGRMHHGITPWRSPLSQSDYAGMKWEIWRPQWEEPAGDLTQLLANLRSQDVAARPGEAIDGWDIEILGGAFGGARLRMASEAHEKGQQRLLFRAQPLASRFALAGISIVSLGALGAAIEQYWFGATLLAAVAATLAATTVAQIRHAAATLHGALGQ